MSIDAKAHLLSIQLLRDSVASFDEYPFNLPAVRSLDRLELHPKVTRTAYTDTEHYIITRRFLLNPEKMLSILLAPPEGKTDLRKSPPSPNCMPDGVLAKDDPNCARHCENSVICNWPCANKKMNSSVWPDKVCEKGWLDCQLSPPGSLCWL